MKNFLKNFFWRIFILKIFFKNLKKKILKNFFEDFFDEFFLKNFFGIIFFSKKIFLPYNSCTHVVIVGVSVPGIVYIITWQFFLKECFLKIFFWKNFILRFVLKTFFWRIFLKNFFEEILSPPHIRRTDRRSQEQITG